MTFEDALQIFLNTLNEASKARENDKLAFSNDMSVNTLPDGRIAYYKPFTMMDGSKYIRIVKNDSNSPSAFCFIEKATGHILKPAGWNAKAKGIRGNIFTNMEQFKAMGKHMADSSWLYR